MTLITGLSGRLNLKDSIVKFRNWNIYEKLVGLNEPNNNYWSGRFEIQKSDYGLFFNSLLGSDPINAEFCGDVNCKGKITINEPPILADYPIIVYFIAAGELKKTPLPQ
jgi:hypothetical protein